MIRINDIIFSPDVLEKRFLCDPGNCHGSCCRYGDSGAPLSDEEVVIMDEIWPEVRDYLTPEGIRAVNEQGTSIIDFENEWVTPLISNAECAYTFLEGSVYRCGIEKAWQDGRIRFRKPLSCHLFPVRVKQYNGFVAVNYQGLDICSGARRKGADLGVYVYEFLKEPLIRAFGDKVYNELCTAAEELRNNT